MWEKFCVSSRAQPPARFQRLPHQPRPLTARRRLLQLTLCRRPRPARIRCPRLPVPLRTQAQAHIRPHPPTHLRARIPPHRPVHTRLRQQARTTPHQQAPTMPRRLAPTRLPRRARTQSDIATQAARTLPHTAPSIRRLHRTRTGSISLPPAVSTRTRIPKGQQRLARRRPRPHTKLRPPTLGRPTTREATRTTSSPAMATRRAATTRPHPTRLPRAPKTSKPMPRLPDTRRCTTPPARFAPRTPTKSTRAKPQPNSTTKTRPPAPIASPRRRQRAPARIPVATLGLKAHRARALRQAPVRTAPSPGRPLSALQLPSALTRAAAPA